MPDNPKPVNDELLSAAFRHAGLVDRFREGWARRLVKFLDTEVYPDLIKRILQDIDDIDNLGVRGVSRRQTRQIQKLNRSIEGILSGGMLEAAKAAEAEGKAFARSEAQWQRKAMIDSIPVRLSIAAPGIKLLDEIITRQPFEGQKLKEWFGALDASTKKAVTTQIRLGLFNGEGISEIVTRVRGTRRLRFNDGVLATSRRNATVIVRSAVTHITQQARHAVFLENENVLKGVQWVATLDSRTCPQCGALDGQFFQLNEGPRPPAHHACRCDMIPVVKTFRELGIDIDEAPLGTRASMNGQVPGRITYDEWLREQSITVQNEALGPARARLYRQGVLSIDDLTDFKGRLLTLDELRRIEGLN